MQYVNMIGENYKEHKNVTLVRYRLERGKFSSVNPPFKIEGGKVYVFSEEQAQTIGFERFKDSFGPLFIVEHNVINPLLEGRVHAEIQTSVEMKRLDAIEKAAEEIAEKRVKDHEAAMKEIERREKEAEAKIKAAQEKAKAKRKSKTTAKAVTTDNMPGASRASSEGKKTTVTLDGPEGHQNAPDNVSDNAKVKDQGNTQNAIETKSEASKGKRGRGRKKSK